MTVESTTAAPIVAPAAQPTSIPQPVAPVVAAPIAAPAAIVAPVAVAAPVAAAPAVVAAPAVAAPPVVAPAAQPAASEPADPNWLPDRLRRAEAAAVAKAMSDLGVVDLGAAKAAIAAAKALEEANKSEIQRISERATKAEVLAAKAATYEQIIVGRLAIEEQNLTDVQRATVLAVAGEDPATRLRTIDAMRPSWAVVAPAAPASAVAALAAVAQPAAPVAAPPAAPAAPAPIAAPVQTAPTSLAPAGASVSASDPLAEYDRLNRDPRTKVQAGKVFAANEAVILAGMEARRRAQSA